jgi:hypothetical protein
MNGLTTIAALPRMGAGFASAQKADVLPASTSDEKLALDEKIALSILGLMGWVPVIDGLEHGAEQIWSSDSFDLVTACTAEEALAAAQRIWAQGFEKAGQ